MVSSITVPLRALRALRALRVEEQPDGDDDPRFVPPGGNRQMMDDG